MISRKYGVLSVRHGPGEDEDSVPKMRFLSAHSDTVSSRNGRNVEKKPSKTGEQDDTTTSKQAKHVLSTKSDATDR
jgi:hypothetical protein